MATNYSEDNNKTGYPLNGGVKPQESPEQTAKYNELRAAYEELLENYKILEGRLDEANLKNSILIQEKDNYMRLLELAIANRGVITAPRPIDFWYGNGPRDVYGNPVVYCNSEAAGAANYNNNQSTANNTSIK